MHGIATGASDTGLRRSRNEDRLLIDTALNLYVVADGMGGHPAGDVAATLAVRTATLFVRKEADTISAVRQGRASAASLVALCERAVEAANREVHRVAQTNPSMHGMGCTLTLLLLAGRVGAMAHVGDTRLYRYRDGELEQLSRDHTAAAELARLGRVDIERIRDHPFTHLLLRSVGECDTISVDTQSFELEAGDRFLLCSDGLTGYSGATDWLELELDRAELDEIPERLVDYANASGGGDNITAIAIEVVEDRQRATLPETDPRDYPVYHDAHGVDLPYPHESPGPYGV